MIPIDQTKDLNGTNLSEMNGRVTFVPKHPVTEKFIEK